MHEMNRNASDLVKFIQSDPLYGVIKDTTLEEQLFSEEYLVTLEEKRWYSTPEVAEWFGINDGQVRYYIKPFHEYLFTEETPSSSTAYRLNIESILKLRMILLLKDEYRVKGLQKLVGLSEGYILKNEPKLPVQAEDQRISDLEKEVDVLTDMIGQLLKTGLFNINNDENGTQITLREDFISNQFKLLTTEDKTLEKVQKIAEEIATDKVMIKEEVNRLTHGVSIDKEEINNEVRKIAEEITLSREEVVAGMKEAAVDKEEIQLQLSKYRQDDVAVRMKERRIETEITAELRREAIKKWAEQNKAGFFAKLFQADQLEIEKELFVESYLKEHLEGRLNKAITEYHQSEK